MTPRIAILDDEVRLAEVLAMVLAEAGAVHTFERPRECLAALAGGGFDLLLTDLKMPDMDGLEVLRRARDIDPTLPVVILTAHGTIWEKDPQVCPYLAKLVPWILDRLWASQRAVAAE